MLDHVSIAEAFHAWLGDDLFAPELSDKYTTLFLGSPWGGGLELHCYHWAAFKAVLDCWAARMVPKLRASDTQLVLLALPEKRCRLTGLRRGQLVFRPSINSASEDVLRQVPGIGASTSRRIVEDRARNGRYSSFDSLVDRGCLEQASLDDARRFLANSEDHSMRHCPEWPPKSTFPVYVRLRNAVTGRTGLRELAFSEMQRAVGEVAANRYWDSNRVLSDPGILTHDVGDIHRRALAARPRETGVAVIDNGTEYLKVVGRLFAAAASRIWVQTPCMRALHVGALQPLLKGLGDAVARGVDVRLLCDRHYAVDEFEKSAAADDIPYLEALGVSCRMYPLQSRMHSRVCLVDAEHTVCGSHTWSATSIFRSAEISVYARSVNLTAEQAERFDSLWEAASPTGSFGIGFFRLWSQEVRERLTAAGITEASQLLSASAVEGISSEQLRSLKREAVLVIEERMPLSVARRLGRTSDFADDAGNGQRSSDFGVSDSGDPLCVREANDLVPVDAFLRASGESFDARD